MYRLHEVFESAIQNVLERSEYEVDDAELEEIISSVLPGAIEETAESMLATIKADAFREGIEARRAFRLEFEESLNSIWGEAFDLLGLFVSLATEIGSDFNDGFREEAVGSNDAVFEALTRLHGRACQVANEILVLLRSGYADGAHARWRTLHEISVVACLVGVQDQELAQRYLLHERIEQHKLARQYAEHYERLGLDPITQQELTALQEASDELVSQFGPSFKNDYGWAASVTNKQKPNFYDIEKLVNLDHWRPYYRMASDNVHANVHGAFYRIGLTPGSDDVILTGPTNAGLADPGHSAAISLCQVTSVMLATRPNFDCIVSSNILQNLTDEVGEAFLKGHHLVESLPSSEDESEK